MEYSIDQILDWKKCDCGRSYCAVFDGGIGEYGESISDRELLCVIEDIENDKHLKKSSKTRAVNHIKSLLDS